MIRDSKRRDIEPVGAQPPMGPLRKHSTIEPQAFDCYRTAPEQGALIDRKDVQLRATRLDGQQVRMVGRPQRVPQGFQATIAVDSRP
ncbi:hypothetical protein D3C78_1758190 [compost metagenome]